MNTKKILIIDDDDDVRMVTRETLALLGTDSIHIEIEEAADGNSGLEMLQTNKYDLVIVDYRMPGLDGTEVINRFRIKDDFATPFVMISGFIGDFEILDDVNVFYMPKPFEVKQLHSTVSMFLR